MVLFYAETRDKWNILHFLKEKKQFIWHCDFLNTSLSASCHYVQDTKPKEILWGIFLKTNLKLICISYVKILIACACEKLTLKLSAELLSAPNKPSLRKLFQLELRSKTKCKTDFPCFWIGNSLVGKTLNSYHPIQTQLLVLF